jgi:hypothetical protein
MFFSLRDYNQLGNLVRVAETATTGSATVNRQPGNNLRHFAPIAQKCTPMQANQSHSKGLRSQEGTTSLVVQGSEVQPFETRW